jgi:hypothetical protein
MRFKTMVLKNSVKAALAAAALTFGVSGAQAQYTVVPPIAGGSPIILPYGGYYGPAIALPTSPILYQPVDFGFGSFGFGNFGTDNSGANYGYFGPGVVDNLGAVNNPAGTLSPGRTVNDTIVEGGIADAVPQAVVPPAAGDGADNNTAAQGASNRTLASRATLANLVTVRRAPYNRVALAYNGNTNGVSSVTFMVLDSHRRELQQAVLTSPPAQTLLRRTANARYYRVVLDYNDGTERTITRPISAQ